MGSGETPQVTRRSVPARNPCLLVKRQNQGTDRKGHRQRGRERQAQRERLSAKNTALFPLNSGPWRQTDRQRQRQRETETDRQRDTHRDTETDRKAGRQTDRQTHTDRERFRQPETEKETDTHFIFVGLRPLEREGGEGETDRQTDRQTQRQRQRGQTDSDRDRVRIKNLFILPFDSLYGTTVIDTVQNKRETGMEKETQRESHTHTETDRQTDKESVVYGLGSAGMVTPESAQAL